MRRQEIPLPIATRRGRMGARKWTDGDERPMAQTQIPTTTTYQRAEWAYNQTEQARWFAEQGEPLRPACMLTAADDLPRQIADMRRQGYTIHGITLLTFCASCQGSGRVPKRDSKGRPRAYAWKICAACKGHDGALKTEAYPVDDTEQRGNGARI